MGSCCRAMNLKARECGQEAKTKIPYIITLKIPKCFQIISLSPLTSHDISLPFPSSCHNVTYSITTVLTGLSGLFESR
jgi:hypothetical protein